MKRALVLVLPLLAVGLVACGDDDDSPDVTAGVTTPDVSTADGSTPELTLPTSRSPTCRSPTSRSPTSSGPLDPRPLDPGLLDPRLLDPRERRRAPGPAVPQARRRADRLPARRRRRHHRFGRRPEQAVRVPRPVQHVDLGPPARELSRPVRRCPTSTPCGWTPAASSCCPIPTVLAPLLTYYGGVAGPRPPSPRPLRGDGGQVGAGRRGARLAGVRPGLRPLGRRRRRATSRRRRPCSATPARRRCGAAPIADSVTALRALGRVGHAARRRVQRVRADRGRPAPLGRLPGRPGRRRRGAVHRRQPRRRRGQARPGDLRPRRAALPRARPGPHRLRRRLGDDGHRRRHRRRPPRHPPRPLRRPPGRRLPPHPLPGRPRSDPRVSGPRGSAARGPCRGWSG